MALNVVDTTTIKTENPPPPGTSPMALTGLGLSAQTVKEFDEDYRTAKDQCSALESEIAHLTQQRDEARQAWNADNTGAYDNLLLRLVDALADPHNTDWIEVFKETVEITSMTCEKFVEHRHKGEKVHWEGTLKLNGAGQNFAIPFAGDYIIGSAAQIPGKVDLAIDRMMMGIPLPDMQGLKSPYRLEQWDGVRQAIAARLGIRAKYFALGSCPNPRLVRIGIRLMGNGRDIDAVVDELDEPRDVVKSVNKVLHSGRPCWEKVIDRLGMTLPSPGR